MADGTVATLGGYPILARSTVGWDLADGTRAYRRAFELVASDAEAILAAQRGALDPRSPGDGVALTWAVAGGPTLTVQRLYPVSLMATGIPQTLDVVVVDARHWWSYIHVCRAYNVRRKVGTVRTDRLGVPLENRALLPDVAYAPWSLFGFEAGNPRPWTPRDVLTDVLDVLAPGRYRIEANLTRDLPIENLLVDDAGPEALARVLATVGGAAAFVDVDGTVVVRDSRDGREALVVPALTPLVGAAIPALVSHRVTRPRKVRVLFTRRLELRFDSDPEQTTAQATQATQSKVDVSDTLTLTNVAPAPDPNTTMADGRIVVQGNWEKLDDLLLAWANDLQPLQPFVITADLIRQTYFVPGLLQALVQNVGIDPSLVLSRRLGTARAHFRATWQLGRKLLDRISTIEAKRAAVYDSVNGFRAPSPAYLDWTDLYSLRGLVAQGQNSFAVVRSYVGWNASLAAARMAPFYVSVLDADQGVLHVDPLQDPWGAVLVRAPGTVVGPGGGAAPSADPRNPGTILREQAQMQAGFRVAVILTVVGGAPNTEARFHVEEVLPAEVEKAIGSKLGPSEGPAFDVRVGQDLASAWVPWSDDKSAAIQGALGMPPFADPKSLVPSNQSDLHALAVAVATQVYLTEVDRVEGGLTGSLNPTVRPIGSVSRVGHALEPDGTATTAVAFPTEPPTIDAMAFLKDSVRRRIIGLVDPNRTAL